MFFLDLLTKTSLIMMVCLFYFFMTLEVFLVSDLGYSKSGFEHMNENIFLTFPLKELSSLFIF